MLKFNYRLVALAAFCVGMGSCAKDTGAQGGQAETREPLYQGTPIVTRADGNTGAPEHGDTYTIMSYRKPYTGNTTTHWSLIDNASNMRQYGYYAYDGTGDIGNVGDLIPVQTNTTSYKAVNDPFSRNQSYGQRLVGVPVPPSTSTTNQGFYYVSVIHPAIPVYNASSELGLLAVFNHADDIYASFPDDKDGNGVKDDPFEIEVRENMDVHNADGVKMFPVRAAIRIYLYSLFFDDDNTSNPVQSVGFGVEEISLVNAGNNGWFNPRTRMIYPNYNYASKTVYSRTVGGTDIPPGVPRNIIPLEAKDNNIDLIPSSYEGINATAKFKVDDVRVFPTDYRGEEGGGSPYIIPMTLSLKLKETAPPNLYNTASVPIALEIENNKIYTFYINVKSKQIEISYSSMGWDSVNETYDDIGGDVFPYLTIDLNRSEDGWDPAGGNYDDIGGN